MRKHAFWVAGLLWLGALAPSSFADAPAGIDLVPFASAASEQRLARSKHRADFFRLANHFETQRNLGSCGPTSAVIVLNALRASEPAADKPVDAAAFPAQYRALLPPGMQPVAARYTQETFLDARFEKIKPLATFFGAPNPAGERDPGLQLRQLHEIMVAHGLSSTLRVVDEELTDAEVESELRANLARDGDFVLVNYHRPVLGQPGGGHISPLGAYDQQSKSFLVLDVNSNKAPWVWVPARTLIAAMRTKDGAENRGYLLLSERPRG